MQISGHTKIRNRSKFYQIERVAQFRYLGRILDENDNDTHALLIRQLARARSKWNRMGRVLRSEGMKPRAMGYFYKAIVQSVLLYSSETWVVSDTHLRQFRSFHSRVGRHLTGRHIRPLEDGSWFCPPTDEVLNDAGLQTIDEYINRRRQTVRGFAMHRPLCEACRRLTALSTNINKAVWWQLEVWLILYIFKFWHFKLSDRRKDATQRPSSKMEVRYKHTHTHTKRQSAHYSSPTVRLLSAINSKR
jgi:hypothetical protein